MTTALQKAWLDALKNKLQELDDPDPDIITRDSYEWKLSTVIGIGRLPKISFYPYGRDTPIKAEIMRQAGFTLSEDWEEKKAEIRQKYGLKRANENEERQLARKFNNQRIKYFKKLRKAIEVLQDAQKRFCKTDTLLSRPTELIISDLIPGFEKSNPKTASFQEITKDKPYNEILAELG